MFFLCQLDSHRSQMTQSRGAVLLQEKRIDIMTVRAVLCQDIQHGVVDTDR